MDPTKVNVSGLVAPKHEHWDPIVPTERNDSGDFSGDLQVCFIFSIFFVFMLGSNNIIQEQYYASHVLYFLIAAFKKSTKK